MDIGDWRRKIDEVDTAVLKLLNVRADMALEIAKLKSVEGIGLRAPQREREIVERMQAANPGPLDAAAIAKIYETIVNQCIRAQEQSRSAVAGSPSRKGAVQDGAVAPAKGNSKKQAAGTGKKRKSAKGRK
jgi:chorismate mutase